MGVEHELTGGHVKRVWVGVGTKLRGRWHAHDGRCWRDGWGEEIGVGVNRYRGHVKRVGLRSGWVLVQSEEGGMPVMGAVCEMGGERRLGVGVERESMGGRTVCETSFEGDGTPAIGAVKRAGLGSLLGATTCAGRRW